MLETLMMTYGYALIVVGTLVGDQLFFHLRRRKGTALLEKYPRFAGRALVFLPAVKMYGMHPARHSEAITRFLPCCFAL
jgi:hypothetical protein